VTLEVATENLPWDRKLDADGGGWDRLLDDVSDMRKADNVSKNTFYYALFNPANSMSDFCGWTGCVVGLSNIGSPNQDWSKSSMGLGFSGDSSAATMIHEVGHAHGREHAPCGVSGWGTDGQFPHDNARLGRWGLDVVNLKLKDPDKYRDVMSYCDPTWMSDYNYTRLFFFVQDVQPGSRSAMGTPQAYRRVSIDGDGEMTFWGHDLVATISESELNKHVELLDADGQQLGVVRGVFAPYSHIEGGVVVIREPSDDVASVRVLD